MNKTHTLIEAGKLVFEFGKQDISILDLGCGPALYWHDAHSHFKISMITGVDRRSDKEMRVEEQNESFLKTMTEIKNSEKFFLSQFKFVHSDIESFVSKTKMSYDLIVCFQILSLINKSDASSLISKFKSLLNTDSLIALCIPNQGFVLKQKEDWPSGIPDYARNKYSLNSEEFALFLKDYKIRYHVEKDTYHWTILSCT